MFKLIISILYLVIVNTNCKIKCTTFFRYQDHRIHIKIDFTTISHQIHMSKRVKTKVEVENLSPKRLVFHLNL